MTMKQGPAWNDLLSALAVLERGKYGDNCPFHCEHDTLWVGSDPEKFSAEELAQLDEWGFFPDEENGHGFMSFRYGSA